MSIPLLLESDGLVFLGVGFHIRRSTIYQDRYNTQLPRSGNSNTLRPTPAPGDTKAGKLVDQLAITYASSLSMDSMQVLANRWYL